MSIKVSDAKIEHDLSDSLNNSTVDINITGNTTSSGSEKTGFFSRFRNNDGTNTSPVVGITDNFYKELSNAIETYENDVKDIISKLKTVESKNAFQGMQIPGKISAFIEGVKETAEAYLSALRASQTQIVSSVSSAYGSQDASISGDLGSDTASVTGAKPNGTSGAE